jgi:phenylacetate-CoA ligase
MIWNEEVETMSEGDMKTLQLTRLQETVARTYHNVPFYKEKLDQMGVKPDDIKTLEDVRKLPFTTKTDLRDHYPYGLFAVPMRDIVRIHASSGTTGKPTVVGYTKADIDTWSECIARLITMAGGGPDDITQISFGYGLFTGAFGLHYGMEKIGAAVIPMSSGNTEKQLMIMQDFKPTILISTPSYALYMSEVAQEMGITPDDIHLRIGMFGAEGHTEQMRQELEKRWGIVATENYGLSEVTGPGVAGECTHHTGMHINEDCFLVEIIDPETGEVLPDGEKGEVVITPLKKEGLPLLRYRTKDISWIMRGDCPCGRTTARLHKIQGRTDDMLIIKGVNVFPSQVESVLLGIEQISPQYQLVVTKKGFTDALEVKVEISDAALLERYSELEALRKTIHHKLHTVLGIDAKVSLVEPKSIERTSGKAKRVLDLR